MYDPTQDREMDRREDRAEEHADRCGSCGECGEDCVCPQQEDIEDGDSFTGDSYASEGGGMVGFRKWSKYKQDTSQQAEGDLMPCGACGLARWLHASYTHPFQPTERT